MADTYPHAEAFQAERTEHGRLTGYTFRTGRLHSARYGWITAAGAFAPALESCRSQAAASCPSPSATSRPPAPDSYPGRDCRPG
ncbi:hypothetical protein GTY54_02910 [Streptomyces sp. SID625]|nr:hypothetical protein [Streptomyces sp. SID625]